MISLVIDKNHGHGRFVFNGYCLAVTDKKHVAKKKDTLCLDRLLYRYLSELGSKTTPSLFIFVYIYIYYIYIIYIL